MAGRSGRAHGTRGSFRGRRGPGAFSLALSLPQMWTRWLALALVAVSWVRAEVGEGRGGPRSGAGPRGSARGAGGAPRGCSPGWDGEFLNVGRGALGSGMLLRNLNLNIGRRSSGQQREPRRGEYGGSVGRGREDGMGGLGRRRRPEQQPSSKRRLEFFPSLKRNLRRRGFVLSSLSPGGIEGGGGGER